IGTPAGRLPGSRLPGEPVALGPNSRGILPSNIIVAGEGSGDGI
ncbi:MAG: hypothetical protein QOG17_5, partial [Gammaproteobacteria bacterium]|nr:hypothetical protein [Gammaproteobacteria bacterium]